LNGFLPERDNRAVGERIPADGGALRDMRVRITRQCPESYEGIDTLRVGRTYDLAAGFASALVVDGYAAFADEQGESGLERELWRSRERHKPWSRGLPHDDDPGES